MDHPRHRFLEDAGLDFEDVSDLTMLEVIRASFRVYGSIFAVVFVIFLVGRRYYRAAFNVLGSSDETRTPLCGDEYYGGWISWMWLVFRPTDDELFEHCGMDAVVFIRTLRYGMKVAAVGALNSIYLMPVYAKSGGEQTQIESVTLGNIPESSPALIAATIASYVVFGAAMYLLKKEFAWFTKRRHAFMSKARPDNYTAFVKHIPPDLRSDDALLDYFRQVFSFDVVVDARVAVDVPALEKLVAEREDVSNKLEHAINILNVNGERPRHKKLSKRGCCSGGVGAETVDSIDTWTAKLEKLNEDVAESIDAIVRKNCPEGPAFGRDLEIALAESVCFQSAQKHRRSLEAETRSLSSQHHSLNGEFSVAAATAGGNSTVLGFEGTAMYSNAGVLQAPTQDAIKENPEEVDFREEDDTVSGGSSRTDGKGGKKSKKPWKFKGVTGKTTTEALKSVGGAAGAATSGALAASKFVLGGEDGKVRDAGFVSFSTLKARASAVQMLHHPAPFTMQVTEAPLPKDVFWANVGLPNKAQQIGSVVAFALTATLCIFWTVPVSFLAALGSVEKLTEIFPFLEDWLLAAPWLSMFLAQLQPLLLVIIVGLLPPILTLFSKREGHISEARLSASLFSKLSIFLLIQIFFVQMISGTILQELEAMLNDPLSIISLLATALPQQAQSFMQYVIVQTFLNLGFEIIRIGPIIIAWIRRRFGPNLTEKERSSPWMGLDPICIAQEMDFADVQANLILYYMILFVYSVLSPFTAFVMGGAFFLFSMCYRHQLLFVYSTDNDTGGQLFTRFAKLVMTCVIIAEITMFGVLSLKKGVIAAPAMIPLIVLTVFFNMYLKQQHYYVTEHLPSIICVEQDVSNMGELDRDFVKGEYLQPALQTRYMQPDNMSTLGSSASRQQEPMLFFTPEHSEVEAVEEQI